MMRIWILNMVALKPSEPGITRHYDLAKSMVEKGHKVTLFASSFNVFLFKWRDSRKKSYNENVNGVKYEWVWTLPYKGNGPKRFLNMISYFFTSIIRSFKLKEKPDVVVGSSVHLFACLAGYFISKWKRATYIVEIRDLWPRTLIEFGAITEKHPLAIIFGAIERFVYKKADRIIVTLPGASNYISSLGNDPSKIFYIPNGISMNKIEELEFTSSLEEEIGKIKVKHKKIAMYVGSHGMANSLFSVVESAKYMNEDELAYVFVGEGAEKDKLRELTKSYSNIYFFDPIPKHEVLSTLQLADVLFVSMLNTELYKYGISLNKLNDYLLSGKPILFAGKVYNDIVTEAQAGLTVPPEEPKAFAEGLKHLASLSENELLEIKNAGYNYLNENHNIEKLAEKFVKVCAMEPINEKKVGNVNESTNA